MMELKSSSSSVSPGERDFSFEESFGEVEACWLEGAFALANMGMNWPRVAWSSSSCDWVCGAELATCADELCRGGFEP